jgi:1-deoxyxylulose-5-phosphate synthase
MRCEQHGRIGLKISVAGIGSMNFGGSTNPSTANSIIDRALDTGVNFVDTANIYNVGESERIVGGALAIDRRRRERVVLSTKVHVSMDQTDPLSGGNSPLEWINPRC